MNKYNKLQDFKMDEQTLIRRKKFIEDLEITEEKYNEMIFEQGIFLSEYFDELTPEMSKSNVFWECINNEFIRIEKYFEIKKEYLPNLYIDENGVYSFHQQLFKPLAKEDIKRIKQHLKTI